MRELTLWHCPATTHLMNSESEWVMREFWFSSKWVLNELQMSSQTNLTWFWFGSKWVRNESWMGSDWVMPEFYLDLCWTSNDFLLKSESRGSGFGGLGTYVGAGWNLAYRISDCKIKHNLCICFGSSHCVSTCASPLNLSIQSIGSDVCCKGACYHI